MLVWSCCRRSRTRQQTKGKRQSPKAEEPAWGAAALGRLGKPFRRASPPPLVASKAVDLEPPERPGEGFPAKPDALQQDALRPALVDLYVQQLPGELHQREARPLGKPDLEGGGVAGGGGQQEGSRLKAGMPHNDSATSLPSNASSAQAPTTPVAPAGVVTGSLRLQPPTP